eukprot:COSAG02_NODE_19355_length_886_cov_0.838628_1_plen_76_part_10
MTSKATLHNSLGASHRCAELLMSSINLWYPHSVAFLRSVPLLGRGPGSTASPTAQHRTAQYSAAQHSAAQRSTVQS